MPPALSGHQIEITDVYQAHFRDSEDQRTDKYAVIPICIPSMGTAENLPNHMVILHDELLVIQRMITALIANQIC